MRGSIQGCAQKGIVLFIIGDPFEGICARSAALILHPVHDAKGIFYVPHPKVDVFLSGGTHGETRGHVLNIALSEANKVVECLQSTFIVDSVAVALRAKPNPCKGLVNWFPSGRWRNHN